MSITDVPPEYAVLTFGCAECGGEGEHEDSESEGVNEAGPEVLETGLLPVPGRLLEGYRKVVGGHDDNLTLTQFYEECWQTLKKKYTQLFRKPYGEDYAKEILAMLAYVDVCIQNVLEKKRLSLSTKAAFNKDSFKSQVRDADFCIGLSEDKFNKGLAIYLRKNAQFACWCFEHGRARQREKQLLKRQLKVDLSHVVETAEKSIAQMTKESDLHNFYYAVDVELRDGVRKFEDYKAEANNQLVSSPLSWMRDLSEKAKKDTITHAFTEMSKDIKFSNKGLTTVFTGLWSMPSITPLAMLSLKKLTQEDMTSEKSWNAGVALWNVFMFYAEKNARKAAKGRNRWPLSRGERASEGDSEEECQTEKNADRASQIPVSLSVVKMLEENITTQRQTIERLQNELEEFRNVNTQQAEKITELSIHTRQLRDKLMHLELTQWQNTRTRPTIKRNKTKADLELRCAYPHDQDNSESLEASVVQKKI
tara:strand:+ start:406 stop:1842 length:1437 start_codon:yes stop_codon:yes gene_type:complete